MRIKGVKQAVARYKKVNSPPYILDVIMLDRRNGKLWVDKSYIADEAIINLVEEMRRRNNGVFEVNEQTVREAAEKLCLEWCYTWNNNVMTERKGRV